MFSKICKSLKPVEKPEKVVPKMFMVTTEGALGKDIVAVKGLVCAWQPRCNFKYGFEDVRDRALVALEVKCLALGGNAIIGLRFDSQIAGDTVFISHVYGTAVVLEDIG